LVGGLLLPEPAGPPRRVGLSALLLAAACDYAFGSGVSAVEAYPWPGGASYRYMGTRDLFRTAGFREISVAAGKRPVMRLAAPGEPETTQAHRN